MSPELSIYAIVSVALVFFATGIIRYDLVAALALMACVLVGLVPAADAFQGFANSAVITVAAVLVISRGLQNAGVVRQLSKIAERVGDNPTIQVGTLTGLTAVMSAFINNVGALALMMPVAVDIAKKSGRSPSFVLMPMAFGSLLGGMTTLIGTPPNLIISSFRTRYAETEFGMFDYSPVGIGVMLVGVAFITLIGWRLVPKRESQHGQALFEIDKYSADVFVTQDSPIIEQRLSQLVKDHDAIDFISLSRNTKPYDLRNPYLKIKLGDVLRVKADPADLQEFVENASLKLSGDKPHKIEATEMQLVEAVVASDSTVLNRTARSLNLRERFNANLIALSRRNRTLASRIKNVKIKAGDVMMLQMPTESIGSVLGELKVLPLAQRDIPLGQPKRLLVSMVLFAIAIAVSAVGWLPSSVAFVMCAIALVLTGIVPTRDLYQQIDWPIIVLLGAMIPVGGAFETSGAAAGISNSLVGMKSFASPTVMLVLLMIITMVLSDILNNAATAIVMAPVAIGLANNLEASPDAFLMAVAIAASCAFLTPIGHQSNTLVMGPGGYRFGDYIWMGIWVEIIVLAVSVCCYGSAVGKATELLLSMVANSLAYAF